MNKKLSIIVGALNQFDLVRESVNLMRENLDDPENTEIIVIDNGSDVPFEMDGVRVVRNNENTGNYPLFRQGLSEAQGEIIAFLHSDVFVYQKGWDIAVRAQFDGQEGLGLLGFIGSTELDNWGGRGTGTVSNMQGRTVGRWTGSDGAIHGKKSGGMTIDGSVVDGCVMIFRRAVLQAIEPKDMPPHHFYDRLMSVQTIEAGWKVGILGIEFDHVSGQTANHEQKWQGTSREWFRLHMGIESPSEWSKVREDWVMRGRNNPSAGKVPDQWDYAAYLEAEYRFLSEYRDQKRLVPLVYGRRIN